MSHLIKITLRRLLREKVYTLVNIAGLSLGMASAILILLFVRHETSFDKFHPGHENIYRIGTDLRLFDQQQDYAVSSAAMGPMLVSEVPEIVSCLRLFYPVYFLHNMMYRTSEGEAFFQRFVYAADSTWFDFFHADFIHGDQQALSKPMAFVFTRSLAMEVFGHTDILGEKIHLAHTGYLTVTAVIEDPPLNTHFRFKGLISMTSMYEMTELFEMFFGPGITWDTFENAFGSTIIWTYIKTDPGFSPAVFMEEQWPPLYEKYIAEIKERSNLEMHPIFHQMKDIHLDSNMLYELGSESDIMKLMNSQMVRVFFLIAMFLVLVASINYTNMAISHFNKRRKEIAVIKILGSKSSQLFSGFFSESMITSLVSLILSLFLVELILGPVNGLLNTAMKLDIAGDWENGIIILGVFILTGALSGLFPALYFYYTPAIKLMVSRFHAGRKTLFLKKALMVIQFAIAAFMISVTLVVYKQFDYMQAFNLGYQVENIAGIELRSAESKENIDVLKQLLEDHSLVQETAITNYLFSMYPIMHTVLFETSEGFQVRSYNNIQTSSEYLRLMGVEVFDDENRNVGENALKNGNIAVNRALVEKMGFQSPVGTRVITHYQFLEGMQSREREVSGIVDDFFYSLINKPVQPLVILPMHSPYARFLAVKFNGGSRQMQDQIIADTWNQFDPHNPLVYFHIEDNVESFFAHNRSLSRFFGYFAWLCIAIAFLGVFGISAYNIEQKKVEIGIRKVMGADTTDLFMMFASSYFFLFVAGCFAGLIASGFVLSLWLEGFAFSVAPGVIPYFLAALIVGITVFLAILIHVFVLEKINPAITLREQ